VILGQLTPRPPALLALNEPEGSLHPDLFPVLAKLITAASARSQIWITTHSEPLAALLAQFAGNPIRLVKVDGQTQVAGPERE
jgi:predicted ATPase